MTCQTEVALCNLPNAPLLFAYVILCLQVAGKQFPTHRFPTTFVTVNQPLGVADVTQQANQYAPPCPTQTACAMLLATGSMLACRSVDLITAYNVTSTAKVGCDDSPDHCPAAGACHDMLIHCTSAIVCVP